jgi:hypothetical protein
MTAKELADWLNNPLGYKMGEIATMLRQQQAEIEELKTIRGNSVLVPSDKLQAMQAEIEALKQIIDANNLNQNIGQFVKPTNEPVAWMDDLSFFTEQPDDMDGVTPLYTHPMRELTDEEIRKVADKVFKDYKNWHHYQIDFARAILRKAQE